jgi:hypothetical protein
MEYHIVKDIPYSIPQNEMLQRIDNRPDVSVSSRLRRSIKKAVSEVRVNSDFVALFRMAKVNVDNGSVVVSDQHLDSAKLKRVLSPCRSAVVFLTTLGKEVDALIKNKFKVKPSYGYILDTAASVAVESATENLMARIERRFEGNVAATLRYSPGYCDWDLREQKKLSRIIPYEEIGVTLSKSYLMSPRKSISGIAGIYPKDSLQNSGNACLNCSRIDCPYRRKVPIS